MRNLAILMALAACATGTRPLEPSQVQKRDRSVTELKLNDHVFRLEQTVRVWGYHDDTTQVVDRFGLLQSARTARANGFTYFTIAEHWNRESLFGCTRYAAYCSGTDYLAGNLIVCFNEAVNVKTTVYDAAAVIDSLSAYGD
jgi:hypothetical protein